MEQSLYIWLYVLTVIMFTYSLLNRGDYQLRGLAAIATCILFIVLALDSPHIYQTWYDTNTQTFVRDVMSETVYGIEPMIFFWMSVAFALFSLLNGVQLFFYKPMMQAVSGNEQFTNPSKLRIPKGFGNGGNFK